MINFDEFERADRNSWQREVERLLKGKPLSKLDWYYEPDVAVAPYYDNNDVAASQVSGFVNENSANGFKIIELLDLNTLTNKTALNALNMGAEGVLIEFGDRLKTYSDISAIRPEHCWFGMKCGERSLSEIVAFFESRSVKSEAFEGFVGARWLTRAKAKPDFRIDPDELHHSTHAFSAYKNIKTVEIPLHLFQEEGASITLELGVLVGLLKTVIENSRDQNIAIDALPKRILISTSVGTDFYHEIAKIRAIRKLAYKLFRAYDIPCQPGDFSVNGRTSRVVESSLDSDTNYLRKTTQALSIVLGTADGLIITPFEPDGYSEDARRITRNIGNLIKEESYGHWVQDPLAGSYFLESLTEKLCEAGWERFRSMEANDGFAQHVADGRLTNAITKDRDRAWQEVSSRRRTLVGVNNYPNAIHHPHLDKLNNDFRHAAQFETLRSQVQESIEAGELQHIPQVLPIKLGANGAMITARLNFSSNFLGCAGFQVLKEIENNELEEFTVDVIVICGSDDDYPLLEQSQIDKWNDRAKVLVVAGNPVNATELSAMGIDALIHMKCDVLEMNKSILRMLKTI